MQIMQIATNFRPGGIQRHVLDLTAALRAQGHSVVLAGDEGRWSQEVDAANFLSLPLTALTDEGGSMTRRFARLPQTARLLSRGLDRFPVGLVHAHETAPALLARLASIGSGRPVVMSYHGAAPEREQQVARIGRLCADCIISPSQVAMDRLVALGLPAQRTRVIGLGVPQMSPIDPALVAARRKELLGGYSGPLVFSLSRLSRQKGLKDMIAVARKITAQHPGAVFAVGGEGPMYDTVSAWAGSAGLGDRFKLLGQVSAVPEHLLAADLFLLTSLWENLPISIVEAFRAGLPVVATDCGGVRELVDDRVGALCKVGDVAGVADALGRLITDQDMRTAKGDAARARSSEDRFDPDHVHARFTALYEEVLSQSV